MSSADYSFINVSCSSATATTFFQRLTQPVLSLAVSCLGPHGDLPTHFYNLAVRLGNLPVIPSDTVH